TAVLAGSALAFGSFAMAIPAAFADHEEKPEASAPASTQSGTPDSPDAVDNEESSEDVVESDNGEKSTEGDSPENETADATPSATSSGNTDTKDEQAKFPTAALDVSEGYIGDTVMVEGSGFSPNTTIELVLSPQTANAEDVSLGSVEVDGEGNLEEGASFTIPEGSTVGSYYVQVGEPGPALSFSVVSDEEGADRLVRMNFSPGAGPSGTSVTVSGSDFSPEGDVIVTLGSGEGDPLTEASTSADEQGFFDTDITVPENTPEGIYEIVAEDVSSQSTTSGDFNVTDATLTIDPEEITEEEFLMDPADGGGVTHTVEGLQQGDKVDFNVGNTYNPMPELSGSAVANEDGVAEYVVYDSSDSAYVGGYSTVVMLTDADVQVASGKFQVTSEEPQVSVSPDKVQPGDSLTVSGHNFSPNA